MPSHLKRDSAMANTPTPSRSIRGSLRASMPNAPTPNRSIRGSLRASIPTRSKRNSLVPSIASRNHRYSIRDFGPSVEHLFGASEPDLSLQDPNASFESFNGSFILQPTLPNDVYPQRQQPVTDIRYLSETERGLARLQLPEEASTKERTGPDISLLHEICFVALICLSMFTAQVGLGQVLNILYIIGDSFSVSDPGVLGWFPAGYSLTAGTFVLLSGRLGDIFGYKRMLVVGYIWFAIWTLVCGLAVYSNEVLFIFARVMAGIGPAITMPNGLAIFGALYPDGQRKAMVFALFGACAPSGSIAGSAFAGLFALAWWPWTFWSFAVILAVLAGLSVFVIPEVPRVRYVRKSWGELLEKSDALGAFLGVTALVLVNFAWNQAGVVGWRQPYVYFCLVLGLVIFLPAFLYVEIKIAHQPLIPFNALTGEVGIVLACIACGWASMGIWLFYLVQFYLLLRNGSPLLVSAWFSPIAISGLLASVTTGLLVGRISASWIMVLALTFFTIGNILVATAPIHQSYWAQTFVCSLVIPWGMDMSFPAGTIIMSNTVSAEHQGVAASLMMTVVNYSISLGLGFASTVETNIGEGRSSLEDVLFRFRGAWYVGIGLAGLGLFISVVFAARETLIKRTRKSMEEERKSRTS